MRWIMSMLSVSFLRLSLSSYKQEHRKVAYRYITPRESIVNCCDLYCPTILKKNDRLYSRERVNIPCQCDFGNGDAEVQTSSRQMNYFLRAYIYIYIYLNVLHQQN